MHLITILTSELTLKGLSSIFLLNFFLLILLFFIGCSISFYRNRADFADSMWPLGFLLIAWISYFLSPFSSFYTLILNGMISFWALRLFFHINLRNRKRKEDFRYEEMKKKWKGSFFVDLLLKVFLFQAILLYIIAFPILWIHSHPFSGNIAILCIALACWLVGFILESISDFQLLRFKKEKKNEGKLFQEGLFQYCRHPNYLGEIIQWWSVWFFAIATCSGWITIISPLLITFLIIFISGIAPLEKKMAKDPSFQQYAKSTPCLIPRFNIHK